MNQPLSKTERRQVILMAVGTVAAYFWNLGYNIIWTPNEAFYAEAVREMIEAGDYVNINYNYEPRFNKPPLLYWLIALSGHLFGLTEFAVRLPSALAGLGATWLTYRLGSRLDNQRLGVAAGVVMAFSFQFVINARYAAPTVLLTFFFTLTIYWFLVAYQERKRAYLWLAYAALGLTVLTKGYPYIIVIGSIILFYLLLDKQFDWRAWWREIVWLRLPLGLTLALLIGMSWVIYMYFQYGEAFLEVFTRETFDRAFRRKSSFKPFFYLEANSWGFLPYSLTFYFGLIYLLVTRFRSLAGNGPLLMGLAWFAVMLVIFTVAKGKIPTYFIQAHPGMSLITAYFIVSYLPERKWLHGLRQVTYFLPALLFFAGGFGLIYIFQAHRALYLIAAIPATLAILGLSVKSLTYFRLPFWPYWSFLVMYLLFSVIVIPHVEDGYRNQAQLGQVIREKGASGAPILLEDVNIHNLPFYAARRTMPYISSETIREQAMTGPVFIVTRRAQCENYPGAQQLWEGLIYDGSETRTLELIIATLQEARGEETRFENFCLLYWEGIDD